MKRYFIFTIILFSTFLMVNTFQFPQCNGNYPDPVNVTISPDVPVYNQPVNIYMSIMAYTPIEVGAYVEFTMDNPDWLLPVTYKQEICTEEYIRTCPISNFYSYNLTIYYRQGINMTFDVEAKLVNPDGNILSCVTGSYTIPF
ncbi:hypothetical protein C1645_789735 [Glomus cerebriforme]|uniref:Phosphatidylglycerol/phosphatidylinositol transfer protein n=1 Tax=Glomus cerebriforme TaxID=658196 RepID=A0A397SA71_9GLOM|nr:hypothetical protein C1645_789735 [Glomus cerebriforme]